MASLSPAAGRWAKAAKTLNSSDPKPEQQSAAQCTVRTEKKLKRSYANALQAR